MHDFAAVYEKHVRQLFGFFAYRTGSRETAEDLTQLTFERALRAWERYDSRQASHATWLHAIGRNLLIDHLRADRSAVQRPLDEEAESLGVDARHDLGLEPELERALATLGDREREVLALRFGSDLAGAEIAAVTGLSLANVQQILSRALRRLRAELEPDDEVPSELRSGGREQRRA
jgi:RNA polymerase sigma factor (sigma-70 family)